MAIPPSSILGSPSINKTHSYWPIVLFYVYAVYSIFALTLPWVGKAAAGTLLLLGLFGLYRPQIHTYILTKPEKWLISSFVLFSIISIISFFYWPQSREARMHLEDYGTFILLVPLYLLIRQHRLNFTACIALLAFVSISLGVISIAQFIAMKHYHIHIFTFNTPTAQFWMRPSGAVNPMRYAAISLIISTFSLNALILFNRREFWCKAILASAFCLGVLACILTQVRGSWLAIPILAITYGIYFFWAGHPRFLRGVLVGLILLLGVASQQDQTHRTITSFERYIQGDSMSSLGSRLDMFKAALILINEKPIFGHGLNTYSEKASAIRDNTPGMYHEVGRWNNPHNEVLQVMVEKGFIGLITLILIFTAPAYLFMKALQHPNHQIKFYAISGLNILIVYTVAGQSVALFEHNVFNHFFTLIILLFASQIRIIQYTEETAQ